MSYFTRVHLIRYKAAGVFYILVETLKYDYIFYNFFIVQKYINTNYGVFNIIMDLTK